MVKECLVKINNDYITVVRYGDIDIQMPSIHKDIKTVFVKYENGKYSIVDKDFKIKTQKSNEKKSVKKKTTVEEVANKIENVIEDDGNA